MSASNPGGRPPLSRETEVINVLVPKELMVEVRKLTKERAATIAGFVRQAITEKLEREKK